MLSRISRRFSAPVSGSQDKRDATSEISTTYTAETPPTVSESADLDDGLEFATPWPNNTYIIIEKSSGQAITFTGGKLCLYDFSQREDVNLHWHCVERNGYFAFFNTKFGVYIGHNGNGHIQASARTLDAWELITPRRHPDGGYQLLTPHWWHKLMVIVVAEDGKTLVRRTHGTTLWEFVKV